MARGARRLYALSCRQLPQALTIEGGQGPRGAVDVFRCILYVPRLEEKPPAPTAFLFQDHRIVRTNAVVTFFAVFRYCTPFAVQLTQIVLMLPHPFAEVLCFPDVRGGAV